MGWAGANGVRQEQNEDVSGWPGRPLLISGDFVRAVVSDSDTDHG